MCACTCVCVLASFVLAYACAPRACAHVRRSLPTCSSSRTRHSRASSGVCASIRIRHRPGSTSTPIGPSLRPFSLALRPCPSTTPALPVPPATLCQVLTSSTRRRRCVPPPSSWFGAAAWVKWPGPQPAKRASARRSRVTHLGLSRSSSRLISRLIWLRLTIQVVARGRDTAARGHATQRVGSGGG